VEWHADTLEQRCHGILQRIDKSGVWTVATTFGALLISGLDSLYAFGSSEPIPLADLAPEWIPDVLLSLVVVDPATVESAESTLQAIFLFEFVLRAW
jgi:hypothetical protein